jgi:hypothetical protein
MKVLTGSLRFTQSELRRCMGVGDQRHGPAALPWGKSPSTNFTGA